MRQHMSVCALPTGGRAGRRAGGRGGSRVVNVRPRAKFSVFSTQDGVVVRAERCGRASGFRCFRGIMCLFVRAAATLVFGNGIDDSRLLDFHAARELVAV